MSPGRFRWVSRSRALRMRAVSPGEDKCVALHAGRCDTDSAGGGLHHALTRVARHATMDGPALGRVAPNAGGTIQALAPA
jgi:hypothetical protein